MEEAMRIRGAKPVSPPRRKREEHKAAVPGIPGRRQEQPAALPAAIPRGSAGMPNARMAWPGLQRHRVGTEHPAHPAARLRSHSLLSWLAAQRRRADFQSALSHHHVLRPTLAAAP